jgi:D-xylose transport system permease protein
MNEVLKKYRTLIILAVTVIVVASITGGHFFSPRNITNLIRQISLNGILSVTMTFIILTGGIDLSVGSVVALAGITAGIVQVNYGASAMGAGGAAMSLVVALVTGLACGAFNGLIIVKSRVVPFIISLGLMVIARGLALILSQGAAIAPLSDEFNWFGQGYLSATVSSVAIILFVTLAIYRAWSRQRDWAAMVLAAVSAAILLYAFTGYRGAPIPAVFFAVVAIGGHYLLNHTAWGRYIVAAGSNAQAAFLSGVPVAKVTFFVYAAMGMASGLSGGILSARLNGAMPTAGDLFELDAIAAVVIGGTRLTGGVGSITGSVMGAFLIGVINNGMSLLNVDDFYQKVIKGSIIIAAVWLDTRGRRH